MTECPVIYGNLTIDDLVFPDGSTHWNLPGGSAAYAACGMLPWTGAASIVAPIGNDFPREVIDPRIDLSRCRHIRATMRNWGLYEEDGERHFISRRASRRWHDFSPTLADTASSPQMAVHVAPMPFEVALPLIAELRRTGTRYISLDLDNHDLSDPQKLEEVVQLIRGVDLFLPSRRDIDCLFPGTDLLVALRMLRSLAPETSLIAIKCGAQGVIAHIAKHEEWIHIPAMPVHVQDVTGAGDAFCGGTLGGFIRRQDLTEGLLCGAISASFCIEAYGLSGMSSIEEAAALSRLAELRAQMTFLPF